MQIKYDNKNGRVRARATVELLDGKKIRLEAYGGMKVTGTGKDLNVEIRPVRVILLRIDHCCYRMRFHSFLLTEFIANTTQEIET